jgi:hypothetical protein
MTPNVNGEGLLTVPPSLTLPGVSPGEGRRQNVYVDFAMRYDRWFRRLATVIGLGPKWTTIRVDDDTLPVPVRMGFSS